MLRCIMIEQSEFAKNFANNAVPPELIQLLEFQNNGAGGQYFSAGFELVVDLEKTMLTTYSTNANFLERIHIFAISDGSGGNYAVWLPEGYTDTANAPIIIFGSEGGFHVVASNPRAFLQLLSVDSEPMVDWDGAEYSRNEDHQPSPAAPKYADWLEQNWGLTMLENASALVDLAQQNHQEQFKRWVSHYYNP